MIRPGSPCQLRLERWISLLAVLSAAAGCSSASPISTPNTSASPSAASPLPPVSAVEDPSIPGIGATRQDWDASHAPNPDSDKFDKGAVYGYDPSFPFYLSGSEHAVYFAVSDMGTNRIQSYILNMHPVDRDDALARVRQELPSDATVAWDLTHDQCYRVAFDSARLQAVTGDMAIVQLEDLQEGGKPAPSPHQFNQAMFSIGIAGEKPTPDIGC